MELNPKVFLARERGLKAGFSVSPSLYIPPPSFHFIPIFQPPVSPFPIASITIDYPHFLLRAAFCNSGCRRIRRLCIALSISSRENRQSNYSKNKTDRTIAEPEFIRGANINVHAV